MRISDWSSDVCSSDLLGRSRPVVRELRVLQQPRSDEQEGGVLRRLAGVHDEAVAPVVAQLHRVDVGGAREGAVLAQVVPVFFDAKDEAAFGGDEARHGKGSTRSGVCGSLILAPYA